MIVSSCVVLTLLISVSVIHQVGLQSLHLLLPVVVSQSVAAKPPKQREEMFGAEYFQWSDLTKT